MSAELPSRTDIFVNALAALDSARRSLSDARDWLASDWSPTGSALTSEAAQARGTVLAGIGATKNAIDSMKHDIHQAIASFNET